MKEVGNRDDDPRVGEVFGGRYRIESVLGRGGMGIVYEATQLSMGRRVALKVLRASLVPHEHPELSTEEVEANGPISTRARLVARFKREARAAGQLSSPHTIRLYDFGETDDGEVYLVSECLNGLTLGDSLLERSLSAGRSGGDHRRRALVAHRGAPTRPGSS